MQTLAVRPSRMVKRQNAVLSNQGCQSLNSRRGGIPGEAPYLIRYFNCILISVSFAAGQQKNTADRRSAEDAIEGLVRDISCPIQNKEATATRFNLQCAMDCAKQGSPLIVLGKNGVIYISISNEMPDQDQRQRLMPSLGKYVKVTGKLYERARTHAIAIESIEEVKGVHLIIDAK